MRGLAMSLQTSLRHLGFVAALATLSSGLSWEASHVCGQASAARPSLNAEQKAKLQERDRLVPEIHKLWAQGKLDDVARLIEQVITLEKAIFGAVHDEVAGSLNALASVQEERADFQAARQARAAALEMLTTLYGPKEWRVTDARLALGNVEVLARLSRAERSDLARAKRLDSQGLALYSQGKFGEAEQPLIRALDIRKQVLGGQHRDYAASLNSLGLLYRARGDYARAEPLLSQAVEIYKKRLGDQHPDHAAAANNLALVYQDRGDYARAEPLFRQVVQIYKHALGEQHQTYARSLNNLALLYQVRGDHARAEPLYRKALEVYKQALGEQHGDYALGLNNLAALYQVRGDTARAEPLLRKALEIYKKVLGTQHPEYAQCLNNLAEVYRSRGDLARAEPLYRQAVEIFQKAKRQQHPSYARSLNNLAVLYQARRDDARAEPLLRQALDIYKQALGEQHPEYARSLNNLALLYQYRGDYARAEPLCRRVLEIRKQALGAQHRDYALGLNNLGYLLYSRGDAAGAEPLLRQALDIVEEHMRHSGAVLSERQLLAMTQQNRFCLDNYLSVCLAAHLPAARAYAPVLAWKGQAFSQQRYIQRARQLHQASDPETTRLYNRLEQASRKLAGLALAAPTPGKAAGARELAQRKEELARLSGDVESLEQQLAERSQIFRRQREVEQDPLAQLKAALPRDGALVDFLEYWHGSPPLDGKGPCRFEHRLLAFVVQPGGAVAYVELGAMKPIQAAVDAWRQTFGKGEQGQASGARLRQLLWTPLHGKLQGARLVLLSPDGCLGRLPFAALPGQKAGNYLIEEQPLAVVPMARLLPELKATVAEKEAAPSLLVVGDVDYGEKPAKAVQKTNSPAAAQLGDLPAWKSLPATRGEMLGVRDSFEQRYPEGRVRLLRGNQATEDAFRREAPKHRWLHVATHGFFAPAQMRSALAPASEKEKQNEVFEDSGIAGFHPGLLSGLVLAGANQPAAADQDDGILTALEVAALDLTRVELAVLSACETGLGEQAGGEGLLGLQRAFQVAGARSVVASLWQVDDRATRRLMERFYDNWWSKKLSRLEALREAQLWMLREGRQGLRGLDIEGAEAAEARLPPVYWAAFVLSGDWR
jgi:CHAT domain-containing protein/Flp pilus assembly protein TadD